KRSRHTPRLSDKKRGGASRPAFADRSIFLRSIYAAKLFRLLFRLLFLLLFLPGLLMLAHHGHLLNGQRVAGFIQLGLDLFVMAFMALHRVHIGNFPGLLVFIVDKDRLAFLVFDPAGQAHGLALFGGVGFFLFRLLDFLVSGRLVFTRRFLGRQ